MSVLLAIGLSLGISAAKAAPRVNDRARGVETVSTRPMRIDESLPLAVVFDVHGTLIESTWRESYVRAYQVLNATADHEAALRWVDDNLIAVPEPQVIERLAAASGRSSADAAVALAAAKDHYRYRHVAKAVDGALEFVRSLRERKVPVIIQSDADRSVIVRQLREAGFLDYLNPEDIFGRDDMAATAPGGVFTDEHRDRVIERLALKYPGRDFVHFNDSFTGFKGIERIDGVNVGIAAGQGAEYHRNREELIRHGADFIIGGFRDVWRRLLEELRI